MRFSIKVLVVAALAAILALGTTATVLAQTVPASPTATPSRELHARGTVKAVDKSVTPPTVTLHLEEGVDLVLKVLATTKITKNGVPNATLDSLAIGDRVEASYNAGFEASGIHAAPAKATEAKGTISAINKGATPPTVTIHLKEGVDVTIKVLASTKITKAGVGNATLDNLAVGDRVEASYNASFEASRIEAAPPLAKHHGFHGTLKSIGAGSIVVTVKKEGKDSDVTFTVNGDTKYKVPTVKDATLANFHAGEHVNILAVDNNGSWVALQVHMIPSKPVHVQRVGTVEAYTAGSSITIKGKHGETSTFALNAETKIKMKKGAGEVKVGERVVVVARRNPATDELVVREILVFGAKGGKKS